MLDEWKIYNVDTFFDHTIKLGNELEMTRNEVLG